MREYERDGAKHRIPRPRVPPPRQHPGRTREGRSARHGQLVPFAGDRLERGELIDELGAKHRPIVDG